MTYTKTNGLSNEYYNMVYNLGDLYFLQKKFDKALFFFKKVDSIYAIRPHGKLEFINSNYYQAKIYDLLGDNKNTLRYSKLYLEKFKQNEAKLKEEKLNANYRLEQRKVTCVK